MESTTLTVRLTPKLKERLGELAELTRRTKSFLAGEAIADYVARKLAIVAGTERGLDDMRTGRVVAHEQVIADVDEIVDAAKTRQGGG